MIIPNLCCSICIDPGQLHCVSIVVPHPTYLPEKSWKRMQDADGVIVVDSHTIDLMKKYGYLLHRRGNLIMSVEIGCEESVLRRHMGMITKQIKQPNEHKEHKHKEHKHKEKQTPEILDLTLEGLDINDNVPEK